MAPLRCVFLVQGEGRGHLTQALAAQQMLAQSGHRVVSTIVGQQGERVVPTFFRTRMPGPIVRIPSPSFVVDAARRGVEMGATLWRGMRRMVQVPAALASIEAQLDRYQPDVVINFFEPLAGLYWGPRHPAIPMVAVAHQYMFLHPSYRFPPGQRLRRKGLQAFARLTAWGAVQRFALSLYPASPRPEERLQVLPPLLRSRVLNAMPSSDETPFLLLYLLNDGYSDAVVRWHTRHPDVRLHCFWDRSDAAPVERYDATLAFHRLDDRKFIDMMARCQGVVCTAGFESVAEAMYLGKPVQAVPVEGHVEQRCNAHDTERAGAGCRSARFDIDRLLRLLPDYDPPGPAFRRWVVEGQTRFVRAIEATAGVPHTRPVPPVASPTPA